MKPHFTKCGLLVIKELIAGKDYRDNQKTCCNAKATGVIPAEFFVTAREKGNH